MPVRIEAPYPQVAIKEKFDYDYPDNLNLTPKSTLHEKIKKEMLKRARDSSSEMSKRHKSWEKIEKTLTAYIPESTKTKARDKGDQTPPIIIPVSYATLETLLTYLTAAFLQDPIFKYVGVGPEDVVGSIMLEKIIQMQCTRSAVGLQLHTMFRDSLMYGFGAAAPVWHVKRGTRTSVREKGFFSKALNRFISTEPEMEETEGILFEGNRLENINPYSYLPDPRFAIHEVQRGEYVGWVDRDNYLSLLEAEMNDDDLFNVRYLKGIQGGSSKYGIKSESGRTSQVVGSTGTDTANPIDVIYMYINIIPKDWEISSSEYPEKWMFGLAADEVVIKAKPLGLRHNMYPVATAAPDYDGYSITPTSRLEIVYGLQETVDFLMNSHIANVRKAVNDVIIVDPMLVNVNDLKTGEPGKIVRTRRQVWGKGVGDVVKQLNITDITQGHVRDTSFLVELIQRITGAVDILQGIMRSGGERRSATEARASRQGALSRLEKAAKIISMQAMRNIAFMFASHTQQLLSDEVYVNIAGRWEETLRNEYGISEDRVKVSPRDLNIEYDISSHDGTMPGGEPADLWIDLYQVITTNPEMAQQFDMVRIFKHMARQLGARNVDDFIRKNPMTTRVVSDEVAEREAQAGNIVPIEESIA